MKLNLLNFKRDIKTYGNLVVGSDKDAQQDAENKYLPKRFPCKSQTSFDGGYYNRAYKVLLEKSTSDFKNERSD
ncbi:MAG: hypothetical protein R2769_15720 [Saprospiraceae bacterium]